MQEKDVSEEQKRYSAEIKAQEEQRQQKFEGRMATLLENARNVLGSDAEKYVEYAHGALLFPNAKYKKAGTHTTSAGTKQLDTFWPIYIPEKMDVTEENVKAYGFDWGILRSHNVDAGPAPEQTRQPRR